MTITRSTRPLLLALAFAAPLSAQDIEKEMRKPAEQVSAQSAAGKLAEEAKLAVSTAPAAEVAPSTIAAEIPVSSAAAPAPAAPAGITYAQILERPDDIDLNFAYAKQQVRRGDLKGAAGTLERVLMVSPDLHAMRLFYGVVLFRLDNLSEAQRELEAVAGGGASPAIKAEAAGYLKAVKERQQLTIVTAAVSAGAEYDSNRNASPTSGKRLWAGMPLNLTGSSRRRDDASFLLMGSGQLRHIVSPRARHEVFTGVSYFRSDQNRVTTVDLQAISFSAGGAYRAGRTTLTPSFGYDRVLLDAEDFLLNSSAGLAAEHTLGRAMSCRAGVRYSYQDSLATDAVGSNPQRRGPLYEASAGASRALGPVMKLDADLAYSAKRAARDYNSYDGAEFTLRHSWLLGKGRFLQTTAAAGNDVYLKPDTAIAARRRKDVTLRAGAVFGLPLSQLHPRLRAFKDVTLTLSAEHSSSKSTVLNYSYENNKAALLLSYGWSAGL